MSIKEFIMQLASKGPDEEFTEVENSFFIFVGNAIIVAILAISSIFTPNGTFKMILLFLEAFSLLMLTKNAIKFKKLFSKEK